MNFSSRFERVFKLLLPAPFTIAVLLTLVTYVLALFFTTPVAEESGTSYPIQLLLYWEEGLWNNNLIVFAFQMMLMLVLGHVLALSKPVGRLINLLVGYCTTTAKAAAIVALTTMMVSFFNWGLGLIFGAILARKVGEFASGNNSLLNYGLIGAAGYSGLMVWHGGLSGSALAKVAEPGHLKTLMEPHLTHAQLDELPEQISYAHTVFSDMNIAVWVLLLTIIPIALYWAGKKVTTTKIELKAPLFIPDDNAPVKGAERLDHSMIPALVLGSLIIGLAVYKVVIPLDGDLLKFFNPNNINFLLLGLALLFHGRFIGFLKATDQAINGASGILIQFPLYFGIMGIMNHSGLVDWFSQMFSNIDNFFGLNLAIFGSAGLVNIFVPSGGGQWAVQGPILIKAALETNLPLDRCIMALAYGDQLTNMLQPFWALPLLGITGLKAKEILPYTLFLFLLGTLIFLAGLLLF